MTTFLVSCNLAYYGSYRRHSDLDTIHLPHQMTFNDDNDICILLAMYSRFFRSYFRNGFIRRVGTTIEINYKPYTVSQFSIMNGLKLKVKSRETKSHLPIHVTKLYLPPIYDSSILFVYATYVFIIARYYLNKCLCNISNSKVRMCDMLILIGLVFA